MPACTSDLLALSGNPYAAFALATGVVQSLKPIQKRGRSGDHEDGDDEGIDMFDAPSKLFKQTLKQFKKKKTTTQEDAFLPNLISTVVDMQDTLSMQLRVLTV